MHPNSIGADQAIKEYNGWLYSVAASILGPGHPDTEDLVQEGRIAMWHALAGFDPARGQLSDHLKMTAKRRMISVANGSHTWTGKAPNRDGQHSTRVPAALSLDLDMSSDGDTLTLADVTPAPESERDPGMARHLGEIRAAVAELPGRQRHYVYSRFWRELSDHEMRQRRMPRAAFRDIRTRLAVTLAHLRDAV